MKLTLQHRNRSFCYAMGHSEQLLITSHRDLAIGGIAAGALMSRTHHQLVGM